MARLAFPPVQFAPPYRTLSPSVALHRLVDLRLGRDDWRLVYRPSDPQSADVGRAIDQAHDDIKRVVNDGVLPSYAHLPATNQFFAIPTEYYEGDWSDVLSDKIFSFPSECLVPPALHNVPILFLESEFENWLRSIGLGSNVDTPVAPEFIVRDTGTAVAEATRLNSCFYTLIEMFAARGAIEGDENLWTSHAYSSSPDNQDWVHWKNSEDIAVAFLRAAIINHEFTLWIRTASGDEKVDPYAIVTVERNMLKAGAYRSMRDRQLGINDRPLWIKTGDWQTYCARTIAHRYGETPIDPPSEQSAALRAMLAMLPASLPDIGLAIGIEEALSWTAYGKPSNDIDVWKNVAGDFVLADSARAALSDGDSTQLPEHLMRYVESNRSIWRALRDGTLASYVAPNGGPALAIPRLYWNKRNPELVDSIFEGVPTSDLGAGYPVLLSRRAFESWRAAQSVHELPILDQPPSHEDNVKWCCDWIAAGNGNGMDRAWDAFKIVPAHNGLSRDDAFRPAWRSAKTTQI